MTELTVERARELLNYDPLTGIFTWRLGRPGAKKGAIVGCDNKNGYQKIMLDRRAYLGHRLAWFIAYGSWPDDGIDHINGNKYDNRIANLRQATTTMNGENRRKAQINNTSGFLGVSWDSGCKSFRASIRVQGKYRSLGRFLDPAEAYQAYLTAKRQLHAGCTI